MGRADPGQGLAPGLPATTLSCPAKASYTRTRPPSPESKFHQPFHKELPLGHPCTCSSPGLPLGMWLGSGRRPAWALGRGLVPLGQEI